MKIITLTLPTNLNELANRSVRKNEIDQIMAGQDQRITKKKVTTSQSGLAKIDSIGSNRMNEPHGVHLLEFGSGNLGGNPLGSGRSLGNKSMGHGLDSKSMQVNEHSRNTSFSNKLGNGSIDNIVQRNALLKSASMQKLDLAIGLGGMTTKLVLQPRKVVKKEFDKNAFTKSMESFKIFMKRVRKKEEPFKWSHLTLRTSFTPSSKLSKVPSKASLTSSESSIESLFETQSVDSFDLKDMIDSMDPMYVNVAQSITDLSLLQLDFLKDNEMLDIKQDEIKITRVADISNDVDVVYVKKITELSDIDFAFICWRTFLYFHSLPDSMIDEDYISDIKDLFDQGKLNAKSLRSALAMLGKEQKLNMCMYLSHLNKLSVFKDHDVSTGIAFAFSQVLFKTPEESLNSLHSIKELLQAILCAPVVMDFNAYLVHYMMKNYNTIVPF